MHVRCLAKGLACGVVGYVIIPLSPSTLNKLAEEWSWSLWCNWAGKGSEGEKNNMPELDKEWDRPRRNAFYKAGFWAAEAVGKLDLSQSTVQNTAFHFSEPPVPQLPSGG